MPPARRSTRNASNSNSQSPQPYTRTNRRSSPSSTRPTASIARPANGKTSLRLTVKAPPSKLRQATSGSQVGSIPPNPYTDNPSESDATPAPATRTARTTRNPRAVVEPESDEDDEIDEDGDGGEDDVDEEMADVDNELLGNEDSEDDAEGDEEDDEEDLEGQPPPPVITQLHQPGRSKPNVTVTAPPEGPLESVEAKEMEEEEDEELSELDSNDEDDEDDDSDDDDEDGSRDATPDLSKLTRRQRGFYEETEGQNLMALSNEALKKKHLTAEEHAMRRAEMARRRKNLSEKRNEEEKVGHPLRTPVV
jgi:Ino eighty subunit 2